MKFGIYGSASGKLKKEVKLNAREIGREIARQNHTVITGGCSELPYEAVLGAYDLGKDIGVLKESGGITKEAIAVLLRDIDKRSNSVIIYNVDPVSLVREVIEVHKKKKKNSF